MRRAQANTQVIQLHPTDEGAHRATPDHMYVCYVDTEQPLNGIGMHGMQLVYRRTWQTCIAYGSQYFWSDHGHVQKDY